MTAFQRYTNISIIGFILLLIIGAVASALDSDDLDELCSTNNKYLKRVSGTWICADANSISHYWNWSNESLIVNLLDNDTIIRKHNTSWISINQQYNSSQEIWDNVINGTLITEGNLTKLLKNLTDVNFTQIHSDFYLGTSLGFNLTDDGSNLHLTSNVEGNNYFGLETDGGFFHIYANPNPANGYLLASITETQGSDTEMNFYEGGTTHNRFWSSGSVRIGGNEGYLCTDLFEEAKCNTPSGGADLLVQNNIFYNGTIFNKENTWRNVTLNESQITDLSHINNCSGDQTCDAVFYDSELIPNGTNNNINTNITEIQGHIDGLNATTVKQKSSLTQYSIPFVNADGTLTEDNDMLVYHNITNPYFRVGKVLRVINNNVVNGQTNVNLYPASNYKRTELIFNQEPYNAGGNPVALSISTHGENDPDDPTHQHVTFYVGNTNTTAPNQSIRVLQWQWGSRWVEDPRIQMMGRIDLNQESETYPIEDSLIKLNYLQLPSNAEVPVIDRTVTGGTQTDTLFDRWNNRAFAGYDGGLKRTVLQSGSGKGLGIFVNNDTFGGGKGFTITSAGHIDFLSGNLLTDGSITGQNLTITGESIFEGPAYFRSNVTLVTAGTSFVNESIIVKKIDNSDGAIINATGLSYFENNVGIGVSSTNYKLEVDGNTNIDGQLVLDSVGSEGGEIHIRNSTDQIEFYIDQWSDSLRIRHRENSQQLVLEGQTGYVGMGTNQPETLLHLKGGADGGQTIVSSNDKLYIEHSDHSYINIGSPNTKNGGILFSDDSRAQGQILYNHPDNALRFFTTGTERFRISSTGKVGILTTTPNEVLEVIGNLSVGSGTPNSIVLAGQRNTPFGGQAGYIHLSTSGGAAYPYNANNHLLLQSRSNDAGDIVFITGSSNTPRMMIEGDGDIGLGTVSPNAHIDITDDIQTADASSLNLANIQSDENGVALLFQSVKTGQAETESNLRNIGWIRGWFDGTGNDQNYLGFFGFNQSSGKESLLTLSFDDHQRVGIGKLEPDTKLNVDGDGNFTGFVQANQFKASDGQVGMTGNCDFTTDSNIDIVDGLIVSCN